MMNGAATAMGTGLLDNGGRGAPSSWGAGAQGAAAGVPPAICVVHPMDIRGAKIGGIESFVRDIVTFAPPERPIVFVGVDGFADARLGKPIDVERGGRALRFIPVARFLEAEQNKSATSLAQSLTVRFAIGLVRHAAAIRRELRRSRALIYLQRPELAPPILLFGRPFIQVLHGEGAPAAPMSSLIRRFPALYAIGERLAIRGARRVFAVNGGLAERLKATHPKRRRKFEVIETWADPRTFAPSPFPPTDRIEILYAGRLDEFKDPELLLATIAELRRRGRPIRFHFIGTGDLRRLHGYALIEDCTVAHQACDRRGVAALMSKVHLGLLCSHFEGLPFFVLEMLSSGRPMVTTHLPQLASLITEKGNGVIVKSRAPADLADGVERVFQRILQGAFVPERLHDSIGGHRPAVQLAKLFADHQTAEGRKRIGEAAP